MEYIAYRILSLLQYLSHHLIFDVYLALGCLNNWKIVQFSCGAIPSYIDMIFVLYNNLYELKQFTKSTSVII